MYRLISIDKPEDVPDEWKGTPLSDLLEYHNLGREQAVFTDAKLLIGMCMDHRKHLHLPDHFAYVIRTAGANLQSMEFKISYAIAVGGVEAFALIGHTHCGMAQLSEKKQQFITGMTDVAGWSKEKAEEHFEENLPLHEIGDEAEFVLRECERLKKDYPKLPIAPLLYKVEDSKLYVISDS